MYTCIKYEYTYTVSITWNVVHLACRPITSQTIIWARCSWKNTAYNVPNVCKTNTIGRYFLLTPAGDSLCPEA